VIKVERTGEGDPLEFEVVVRLGNGETRHRVTMARDTCERLTMGTHTPRRCIKELLAELDLLMAVDGYPSIADLRAAGAQYI
jgi:hypothetical protein